LLGEDIFSNTLSRWTSPTAFLLLAGWWAVMAFNALVGQNAKPKQGMKYS